ncbi:MAG: hypothetical protein AAGH68_03005 [Pseudomonadota bacterium]
MRFAETFAMMLLVAGAASLATAMIIEKRARDRLASALAERPPIAVIDYSPVLGAMAAGRPFEDIQATFTEIGAAGDDLASRGYLVLTTAQIVKAPRDRILGGPALAGGQSAPAASHLAARPDLDLSALVDGMAGARVGFGTARLPGIQGDRP